jgi:hypothetical protein
MHLKIHAPQWLQTNIPDPGIRREVDSRSADFGQPHRTLSGDGADRQGGMGAVYLAVRTDEFRQQVASRRSAVEWMRRSISSGSARDGKSAGLEHPNVARLLDGGASADGLPV